MRAMDLLADEPAAARAQAISKIDAAGRTAPAKDANLKYSDEYSDVVNE